MTVLFINDWVEQGAIPDYDTPNKSFITTATIFKRMGVANHQFMLALHDQRLKGVDPHDPDLDLHMQSLIALECANNYWYYLRECFRVPGIAGEEDGFFRSNIGIIAVYWLLLNHVTTFYIGPRQLTGKSFGMDVLSSYVLTIVGKNTMINLLTKDEILRSENLKRIKNMLDALPEYLNQKTKHDISNTSELQIASLGNTFKGHLPRASEKDAIKVGRGLTAPILQNDEGPFQRNIGLSLPSALAAGSAARLAAKRAGRMYYTALTTTVTDTEDPDGKYIYTIKEESAKWTEGLLDAEDEAELHKLIRNASPAKKLRVDCTFNHKQLGYTNQQLKDAIEDTLSKSSVNVGQDFFNIWSHGSRRSILPKKILEGIRKSRRDVLYAEIFSKEGFIVNWYIPKNTIANYMRTNKTILALDTSNAVGKDDIGLTLRSITTGEIIAAGVYNETNLSLFSEWLFESWFAKYDQVTGIIEARSSGNSISDYLILHMVRNKMNPFKRLFNRVVNDKDTMANAYAEVLAFKPDVNNNVYIRYGKHFGFATSGSGLTSRSKLYSDTLFEAAKNTGNGVHDDRLISQIGGLVEINGRVDHVAGGHDDLVIAWLLSYWFLSIGSNLEFYGINPASVLSKVVRTRDADTKSSRSKYIEYEDTKNKEYINNLMTEYQGVKSSYDMLRIRNQILSLSDKISVDESNNYSKDALLQTLRDGTMSNKINKKIHRLKPGRLRRYIR